MKLVEIGKLCKLQNGKAFKPTEWSDKGLPIVRIQNLNNEEKPFNYCDFDVDKKFHIDSGDLLFSWSGTPGTSFGAFFWHRGPAILNQHIFNVLIDESLVRKDYFRLAMNAKLDEIIAQAHGGVGLQHITKGKLEAVKIPLPPLETQKQIAAVLEKADQLRKDCQQMEQELNSLAQSVFIDMFGDPVTNPKGWEVRVLSNVVETIQGGKSPKCESRPALNNEWGILKLSAVTGGLYRPDQNKAILEGTLPNPDIELKQGDLLFTRKNTYELVGACAYVRETPEQLMLPDLIFRFQMPEQLKVYLWGLLNNQSFNLKVRALASGAAGSMPNIAKSKLYDLTLPLPPESEIEKYTRSIVGIWEQQDTLKELRGSYQANFNALMQKAFKGELNL
ncbi:TPA: restriction endonuclease subunit S [Vibrio cholerae]|uniref:restriction endonuclease subunit S n=1 Tax=Vibrio cholerae TaxID=666 RepID=UPI000842191A|nr:restriction endonuclease subunit S [Vibrio cholerae]HDZ9287939.1 restriction endonuclease subunit S [Vibrio cholerae]HDZ9291080.1 restriction endonuclease subunit S [Vibrio cholerae]